MSEETKPQTLNQVALWAMITGVAGLTVGWMIPLPWSLAAVILGHIGLSQVKRGNGYGRGYAIAGLATGYTGIGLVILFIGLFALAIGAIGIDGVMNIIQDSGYNYDNNPLMPMPGMMNP